MVLQAVRGQADSECMRKVDQAVAPTHRNSLSQPKNMRIPSRGIFGPLMKYIDNTNPQEFKLTDDIRNTFANSEKEIKWYATVAS